MCANPLPTYKYPPTEAHGYKRAPLDTISFWNGVAKFDHGQACLSTDDVEYALECLNRWFPYISKMSEIATDEEVRQLLIDHKSKTSGYPWSHLGAGTKGSALEKFGLEQLEAYYRENTSMVGATLKSEIRPIGKDARLFRPQDVTSYIEGVRLFLMQNYYLMETLHYSPLFNKYVIPGLDLLRVFATLETFGGSYAAADGASWDANFPLSVAAIIATFRSTPETADRIQRYYSMMYNGYTNCQGHVLNLVGQPSGHHNTSIDNSLGQCICMAIHARRSGLTVDQFFEQVKFFCCGDDLLYADKSGFFLPEMLSRTYESIGLFLEFEGDGQLVDDVYRLAFVGMRCGVRERNGVLFYIPYLREQRTRASATIHKRKATPADIFAKFVSLAQLSFGDPVLFAFCKSAAERHLQESVANNTMSLSDPAVRSLLHGLQDDVLYRRHLSWESFFTCQETVRLKNSPFKGRYGSSFGGNDDARSTRTSIRKTVRNDGVESLGPRKTASRQQRTLVLRSSVRNPTS